MKLSAISGGDKVKIWADSAKTAEIKLNKTWNVVSFPDKVYVEGIKPSGTVRDVKLRLEYIRGKFEAKDDITMTALKVEMTNLTFGMGWDLVPDSGGTYPTTNYVLRAKSATGVYEIQEWINDNWRDWTDGLP